MSGCGFVVFHRKVTEWCWYKKPYMLRLFTHLVLMANHRPQQWEGISVERGQLVTGRLALSEQTGISQQSIRTCLARLEQTGEIVVKSTNKFSIITVCNYDKYQGQKNEANQQSTSNQPAINQQLTTNNNVNNENNENKKATTKQPGKVAFDPVAFRPAFIPENLWSALIDNRKFKKLQNSEIALKAVCKNFLQAVEAGYDIEDCIGTYISSNWQVFKAEYMKPRNANQAGADKPMSTKEKHAKALLEVIQ